MKRWHTILPVGLLVLAIVATIFRGNIRDAWDEMWRPELPPAQTFAARASATNQRETPFGDAAAVFEGGVATSAHYTLETAPKVIPPRDPLAFTGELPAQLNLAVPFSSQAPHADWSLPYEEACEEAAIIMADAFYSRVVGDIAPTTAERAIKQIVSAEKKMFGFYEDTTAEQTALVAERVYGYSSIVKPFNSIDDLKRVLALGYPVLLPTAGTLLNNPNFRNGGPAYHMLVLRGYTPDFIITNDPGTRKGKGYTYSYDTIMNAAHDWNGGDVLHGKRVMLVLLPQHP